MTLRSVCLLTSSKPLSCVWFMKCFSSVGWRLYSISCFTTTFFSCRGGSRQTASGNGEGRTALVSLCVVSLRSITITFLVFDLLNIQNLILWINCIRSLINQYLLSCLLSWTLSVCEIDFFFFHYNRIQETKGLSFCLCFADALMADQRMDISSTMNEFMSPSSTDLISSSMGTPGMDYTRKRKSSITDYQ